MEIEPWQDEQRHHDIDAYHHEEGQRRQHDGRRRIAVAAVVDLGGIELARSRRALAHHLVIRHRIERNGGCHSIAFALAAGGRLDAAKPPKAEAQHDGGGNEGWHSGSPAFPAAPTW